MTGGFAYSDMQRKTVLTLLNISFQMCYAFMDGFVSYIN